MCIRIVYICMKLLVSIPNARIWTKSSLTHVIFSHQLLWHIVSHWMLPPFHILNITNDITFSLSRSLARHMQHAIRFFRFISSVCLAFQHFLAISQIKIKPPNSKLALSSDQKPKAKPKLECNIMIIMRFDEMCVLNTHIPLWKIEVFCFVFEMYRIQIILSKQLCHE